jgi:eukaryotic-like serine/threonine-protein kinase
MRPGTTVAGRFEIEARAGAGGMGVVYRARDRQTGETVALKVLHTGQPSRRFELEANTLAELSHPAVVRYVAHGTIDGGRPYLAMEWIAGTSLAEILKQRRLGVAESLVVVRRVAEGLSAAHRRGVVHRDVKPSNIHLPAGALGDAKLIDFGVARRRLDPHITESGLLVGTLAYMSPEQASGDPNVEPSSDIFSLGCVLYKCLTGESPFSGGDATAVLAKVLLEEPASVRELAPDAPEPLAELVQRMLAKSRDARPRSVEELLRSLAALADVASPQLELPRDAALTARERRLVSLVLVGGLSAEDTDTRELRSSSSSAGERVRIDVSVTKHGGRYDLLADGTAVATFAGSGAPTDEALRAVRCGLEISALAQRHPVVVAVGLSVTGGRLPVGEAIDRGSQLLARAKPGLLRVDPLTARLIGASYAVDSDSAGLFVTGERRGPDVTRKLLGRPTPCVGRDRELELLESLFDECRTEPVARAALVLGPPGVGKSRLRYELVKRLESRGVLPELWVGRGDSSSAGSPFSLLRDAIRRSAGIQDGEQPQDSRDKLLLRLERSLGAERARAVAPFIGELARVPFDSSESEALRAARGDPTLMGDAMRVAWLDLMAADCERAPLLIVLEDLQWGDGPTAGFAAAALTALSDRPLMVLAIARPELRELLPGLWKDLDVQELRLRPLLGAASERLVRDVLGDELPASTTRRIVELADGNAFHLEELIRAVAEGRRELPESVIGMVQSRLEELPAEERRALRAASVFGERFWSGGVAALTGGESSTEATRAQLAELVGRELVGERSSSALSGQTEYVFRSSLVREAAYATLTDDDRTLGHRLAAEWLERSGESEPVVLAEHFHRGSMPARAAGWYARAAERALEGDDVRAALERVEQALACDPSELLRGELAYVEGHARMWLGSYPDAERPLHTAIRLLEAGSARWYAAVSDLCHVASCLDRAELERDALELALGTPPRDAEASAAQAACLARAAAGRLKSVEFEAADELIDRVRALAASAGEHSHATRAWLDHALAARSYFSGDVVAFQRHLERAVAGFEAAGDLRNATTQRVNLGYLWLQFGDYERAELELRTGHELCERLGLDSTGAYALHNLGLAIGRSGRLDEAIEIERRAIETARRMEEIKLVGAAGIYLTLLLLERGQSTEAIEAAQTAIGTLAAAPVLSAYAHALLARSLLAAKRAEEALAEARLALDLLGTQRAPDEIEANVRLSLAEAAHATGTLALARETIGSARSRLLERAQRIDDSRLRQSFLERVPEHARTLELAAEWLPEAT